MNDTASTNPGFGAAASIPTKSVFVTLLKLFAAGFVALTVAALLLPSASRGREAARRTQCKNNLKQIALALHDYESTYGQLPPTYTVNQFGKPLHSWRTLILPFLEQQSLYETIDLSKAWNDPANVKAYSTNVPGYYCPSMSRPLGHTTYRAVLTPGSCMGPITSRSLPRRSSVPLETWMVIEVPPEQSTHWMDPVDADEQLIFGINTETKTAHVGGIHAAYADGSVRFESANMPADERRLHMAVTKVDD